jgi:hypothetical protein
MSQSDFVSLTVILQNDLANETLSNTTAKVITNFELPENAVPRCEHVKSAEVFDSVKFIPVEVYAFLEAWEEADSTRIRSFDFMELDSASFPITQDMFEPARLIHELAPPKRFYRTFWRSAARRILELPSTHDMECFSGTSL